MDDELGSNGELGVDREGGQARRRRLSIVLVSMVAAAVLVVAVGVVVLVQVVDGDSPGESAGPAGGAPVALPESVEPSGQAQRLATDGAVGRGALVFTCRDCDTTLVLADGTQRVLTEGVDATSLLYGLSPDGRWLTVPQPGGETVVRDLTGDRVHRVQAAAGQLLMPWVWSPDSRWLLFGEIGGGASGPPASYRLLDLAEGTDAPVTAPAGREYVAVLPSGQLWAVDVGRQGSPGSVRTVEVEVVDPGSGEPVDAFTVDGGQWLEAGESLSRGSREVTGGLVFQGGVQPMPAAAGDGLYLPVFADAAPPVALLRADRDGKIRQRQEIAVDDPRGIWLIAGQLGGRVVLSRSLAGMPGSEMPGSVTLYAVSDSGLRELTRVASAVAVRVPGAAVHGGSPL